MLLEPRGWFPFFVLWWMMTTAAWTPASLILARMSNTADVSSTLFWSPPGIAFVSVSMTMTPSFFSPSFCHQMSVALICSTRLALAFSSSRFMPSSSV